MTNHVSSIRLFILGTLSASGPLHGHQIRQQAQSDRTENWADIQPGSVYGALKRLANEDLIREVRTERVGNRPERTIYEITPEGRRSLAAISDAALRDLERHYDAFDLALTQARDIADDDLEKIVENRIGALRVQLDTQRSTPRRGSVRERGRADGDPAPDRADRSGDPLAHRARRAAAEDRGRLRQRHRRPAATDRS